MTASGRIPCINPRCRRTADAAKFDCEEIICGKCFRSLPAEEKLRWVEELAAFLRLAQPVESAATREAEKPSQAT